MEDIDKMKSLDNGPFLSNDFDYSGCEEWKKVAVSSLNGGDFSEILITDTYEGITLDPIYSEQDLKGLNIDSLPGRENFLRGQGAKGYLRSGWEVCQRMGSITPEEFNSELISALESGQNSIFLDPDREAGTSTGYDDMKKSLRDINLLKYPVVFDTNLYGFELLMLLNSYLGKSGVDLRKVHGAINLDPLAVLSETGELNAPPDFYYRKMGLMIKWARENDVKIRMIGVSALPYHNSGASAVQELAIALSTGVEYIEEMKVRGIPSGEVPGSMSFKFGIGSDFFMEIVKLRAARLLWNRILKEYGAGESTENFFVHSETSMFNKSRLDPYVNMLRITTETFSAIAGGADRITTNPFDSVFSPSSVFSRRIAKNVQMVLKEESHLHRLIDPAGGSYYVEKLTSELAKKSWEFFLEMEKRGGARRSLESGFLRERIEKGTKKLKEELAQKKKILVGTNSYNNPDEKFKKMEHPDNKTPYTSRIEEIGNFEKKNIERDKLNFSGFYDLFNGESIDVIDIGTDLFQKGATLGEISFALKGNSKPFHIHGKNPEITRLSAGIEEHEERENRSGAENG